MILKTLIIVNPNAGRGTAHRLWKHISTRTIGDPRIEVVHTTRRGDATLLARAAAQGDAKRVIAVGGDGTISEVANGLLGSSVELGLVPAGTGNDFCRSLTIPKTPLAALDFALTGRARALDVGVIAGGPCFVNVAGVGFDAEVARTVNHYPKYLGGTLPYLAAILTTLWRYSPVEVQATIDGNPWTGRVWLLALGNCESYGGGMRITPGAVDDDGELDICIAGDLSRSELLGLVPRIYKGGHVGHPKVILTKGRRIQLQAAKPLAMHADGEVIGQLPVSVEVRSRHLKVVAALPSRRNSSNPSVFSASVQTNSRVQG